MKRLGTFRNAYTHYHGGWIKKTDETENNIYYEVEDQNSGKTHIVIIELTDNQVVKARCDCTMSSVKSKHEPICSHKITALVRTMFDYGRPKNNKI